MKKVLVTGGAGYVGSELIPYFLKKGYKVTSFDLMIYGNTLKKHKNLKIIKGDIRNEKLLGKSISNHDILIHLACISNDPSFELDKKLGKEINLDSFEFLVKSAKKNKIRRFIYASSASVYGVKKQKNVYENAKLTPLTDYSKFKIKCEKILNRYSSKDFITTSLRPATLCGCSRRLRLDLAVNLLTNQAFHRKEMTILGGDQLRPNLHIKDMIRAYECIIHADQKLINGQAFNVGYQNISIKQISRNIKKIIGKNVNVKKVKSNDNRSYHISSLKIKKKLKFRPIFTISDAILDLKKAFRKKIYKDPLNNQFYFNIKRMQKIGLK